MFSRVFLICALALVASAYQIGGYYQQGVQSPEERYGGYQFYLRLIRGGSPYYQGNYKQYYPYSYASRYYGPAVDQEEIYAEPQEQQLQQVYYPSYYQQYYPQYISNLLRYPFFARYFQQYYNQPLNYERQQQYYNQPLNYEKEYQYQQVLPYYYNQQYYNRVPYQQREYGQQYGRDYIYNQYQQSYNRVPYQQQEYGQQYGRGYIYNQYQQYPTYQGRYYSSLLNRILGYQQYQPEYVY